MNATASPVPTGPTGRDDRDVRFAWACLLSAPVVFVLTFVLGYGLATLLGSSCDCRPPD